MISTIRDLIEQADTEEGQAALDALANLLRDRGGVNAVGRYLEIAGHIAGCNYNRVGGGNL